MIDRTPHIGRYIILESILRDGFFGKCGKITGVSGSRIYYEDLDELLEDKKEKFTINYAAICDSYIEVEKMHLFSKRCVREISELKEQHEAVFYKFFMDGVF